MALLLNTSSYVPYSFYSLYLFPHVGGTLCYLVRVVSLSEKLFLLITRYLI